MAATVATRLVGGHSQTVLSIVTTNAPNVRVISGAECGELAVWSCDGVSVNKFKVDDSEDDVTSIVCSAISPDMFYVSCGVKIYCYDLRQLGSAVAVFNFGEEEINEIALNDKENFLAAADDSGNIKVINITDAKVFKTLRKHTNICSSVRFRPHRPWELLSSAYDSKLIQWDFSKSRAYCIIDMQEIGIPPDDLDSYVVGPPFVHSIAVSPTGGLAAVGTEDAVVHVFDASKRTLQFRQALRSHSQGVSQVHFPPFGLDRYIISGGNDGRVCIWDLENEVMNGPSTTNGCSPRGQAVFVSHVVPKYEIRHTEKINWLSSNCTTNSRFIAVADNTETPLIFPFPN